MKTFTLLLCTLAIVCLEFVLTTGAPLITHGKDEVQILKFDNDNIGIDGYNFSFETSDGVSRRESAKLKNVGTEDEAISVQGWVTWKGPDGVQYTLNYLADENGFQPEGAHLPVAPEV